MREKVACHKEECRTCGEKCDINTDAMLQIYRKDTASIQDNRFKIHLRVLCLYLQPAKLPNNVP